MRVLVALCVVLQLGCGDSPKITHSGSTVANAPGEFAYSYFAFTGTLRDPSRIGSTTELSGTLRWTTLKGSPRTPTTCVGTGTFTGTVN